MISLLTPQPPSAILANDAQRPWPRPTSPWIMAQTWSRLLFAHWPVTPEMLRPLIPARLSIDTFDGRAWVGVVPFYMSHVRARGLSPVPGTNAFCELNVRTYVTHEHKAGVWFFSLDAANPLAVFGARRAFHLPYYNARMALQHDGETVIYQSERTHRGAPPAAFRARYRPTSPVYHAAPGTLLAWLTERYCLYAADRRGSLYRGDIQHAPWPLHDAEADLTQNTMAQAAGITLPDSAPLLHYTEQLDVLAWSLRRV